MIIKPFISPREKEIALGALQPLLHKNENEYDKKNVHKILH